MTQCPVPAAPQPPPMLVLAPDWDPTPEQVTEFGRQLDAAVTGRPVLLRVRQ